MAAVRVLAMLTTLGAMGLRLSLCPWLGAIGVAAALGPLVPPEMLASAPAGNAPAEAGEQVPGEISSADDLLLALESADEGIDSLDADLRWHKEFGIAGDTQVRDGRVYVERTGTSRRFAIEFETLTVGVRRETEPQQYIFDGVWLVEKRPGEKRFIKTQIVREGEDFDPLKIGEGPFPFPVGQKRADVLERFVAVLVPETDGLPDERLVPFVEGTWQLLLTPRRAAEDDEEFTQVRVWYRKSDLLPRLAWTTNSAQDVSIVQLRNVRTNGSIAPGVFDTTAPTSGWDVDIRPWRDATGP